MYQALYRKWRPKSFDDVVGQDHITETLKNQVSTGRLSHAYLFIGTRGTGKTTCAKILAKAVNCESPVNGNPCNECRSCRGIDDGSVMDVVEIDAASNNGVDNVRDLRDEAVFSPGMVKKRVYIIDEVHMLSSSAFNALLKILEEPPGHLMFILATTELHKVPATILSRCQRHSFKRLDADSIIGRLNYVAGQEGLDLRPDAASLIARLAEGGMRDALSLLDQCSGRQTIDSDTVYSAMGLAGKQDIALMLRHIAQHNTSDALVLFQKLWQNGKDPTTLLGELSSLLRDALMISVAPKGGAELMSGGYDDATLSAFAKLFSPAMLISSIEVIQHALADMRSGQVKTVCELCLITLCEPELGNELPVLRERVERLEKAFLNGVLAPASPAAPVFDAVPAAKPETKLAEMPPLDAASFVSNATPSAQEAAKSPVSPAPDDVPFDIDPPAFAEKAAPSAPEKEVEASCSAFSAPVSDAGHNTAPVFPSETTSGADLAGWDMIKASLKGKMPLGLYTLLTDPVQVSGTISGDTLTLAIQPGFAMNMLDRPDILSDIAKAASAATGRPMRVVTKASGGETPPTGDKPVSKLDSLGKFNIVSYK